MLHERLQCREVASLGGGVPPEVTVALAQTASNDCSESKSNSIANVRTYNFYPWRRSGFPCGRGGGVPISGGLPVQEASGARGWEAQQGNRYSPPCPTLGLLFLPFLLVPPCPHIVPSWVAPPLTAAFVQRKRRAGLAAALS